MVCSLVVEKVSSTACHNGRCLRTRVRLDWQTAIKGKSILIICTYFEFRIKSEIASRYQKSKQPRGNHLSALESWLSAEPRELFGVRGHATVSAI